MRHPYAAGKEKRYLPVCGKIIPKRQNGRLKRRYVYDRIVTEAFCFIKQGAIDLIKGCLACVAWDISFMLPVGLLYQFVW